MSCSILTFLDRIFLSFVYFLIGKIKLLILVFLLGGIVVGGGSVFWRSSFLSSSSSSSSLPSLPEKKLPSLPNSSIVLAFVGDISLSREVNWQIQQHQDPAFPFQKTAAILRKADLAIGNLEGPLLEDCPLTRRGMKFCGQAKNADGLVYAGFDLLNLANNHIGNYGPEGVAQTIQTLKKYQLGYFFSQKIAFEKIKDIKLAFLGFDDTLRPLEDSWLSKRIKEAKKDSDLAIVNFHWGEEYQKQPSQRQKYLAHLAIDQGADLVVGHHPHVLQPQEKYRGKLIFYSLGNFVFDQMWSKETRRGGIVLIFVENKKISRFQFIPVFIHHSCQPWPEEEESSFDF